MIKFKNKDGTLIAVLKHFDVASKVIVADNESNYTYLRVQNSQVFVAVEYEVNGKIKLPGVFNKTYQIGKDGVSGISTYLTVNIVR